MPAAPIGSSWASGSWLDTAWEAGTWADSSVTAHPSGVGGTGGVGNPFASGSSEATGGWTGGDATPGYTSPSWVTREYRRQPGQRPRRKSKPVPVAAPPAPDRPRVPIVRVPFVAEPSQPVPVVAHARIGGGTGGVGQPVGQVWVVAHARASSAVSQDEWFLLNLAMEET